MDKSSLKYASIAEKPSTFGVEFHNKGYEFFGINAVYIPLRVSAKNLESAVQLVRDNFNGCGVSMPHKINVIEYLDSLDQSVVDCEAVNTIVKQEDGSLRGYNTDYYGSKRAIESNLHINDKDVLLLGAGGAARAIGKAVVDLGGRLTISNRTYAGAMELSEKLGAVVELSDFWVNVSSGKLNNYINQSYLSFITALGLALRGVKNTES